MLLPTTSQNTIAKLNMPTDQALRNHRGGKDVPLNGKRLSRDISVARRSRGRSAEPMKLAALAVAGNGHWHTGIALAIAAMP